MNSSTSSRERSLPIGKRNKGALVQLWDRMDIASSSYIVLFKILVDNREVDNCQFPSIAL